MPAGGWQRAGTRGAAIVRRGRSAGGVALSAPLAIADGVALAPLTTLGLGGPARHYVEVSDAQSLRDALAWARTRSVPVTLLGGGSNVVVADAGVAGLVIAMRARGVRWEPNGAAVRVTAAAGERWDALVAEAVARDLAGIECMSGVPGLVGAVPIQNVGAYGQEVASTITEVEVMDRATGRVHRMQSRECDFAYRDSRFKHAPDELVVLSVSFDLVPGGAPTLRYAELADALAGEALTPTLASVRDRVLALRRGKAMLIEDGGHDRSVGSFFLNPIVEANVAEALFDDAVRTGIVARGEQVPRWPMPDGRIKLAAGWLVERAGVAKGERHGSVGISPRHALCLVHHGGGTSAALCALARDVRARVHARFGIELVAEPTFVGFGRDPLATWS